MPAFYYRSFSIAAVVTASMGVFAAQADNFKLDYGNVAASDKQITITRLPIFKNNGTVVYKDVIIKLQLNNKRQLIVQKKYPKTTNSKSLNSAKLVSGKYVLEGSSYIYDLVGPGVGPSGREVWSLIGLSGSDDAELTFYSGPVKGHPLEARIYDAGVTSSPYTFGISASDGYLNSYFQEGCLISAHMNSGYLKLNSHSEYGDCDVDYANPTETTTFTMCTPQDNCD